MTDTKPLTQEDFLIIIKAYQEAAEEVGKTIKMIELHQGDDIEIIVDNRTETDLN